MRLCSACGGELRYFDGEEVSARERGGNAIEKDTFVCGGCPRQYRHVVRERFSGNVEWWGVKQNAQQEHWDDVAESDWPKFR